MMRSLYSGVSGLKNHQTRMDVVGNNISNVNTTGFKSSRVTFSDTLSQTLSGAASPQGNLGGTNPKQIGLGSSLSSIDTLFTDGSVQSTGVNTDLCLSGNGLFIVKNGDAMYYTRNGNFKFDKDGYYVNSDGMKVAGWCADKPGGTYDTKTQPGTIRIEAGETMEASATKQATFSKNLDAAEPMIKEITITTADGQTETITADTNAYKIGANYTPSGGTASTIASLTLKLADGSVSTETEAGTSFRVGNSKPKTTIATIYDSLGNTHDVVVYMTKLSSGNTGSVWRMSLKDVAADGTSTDTLKDANGNNVVLNMGKTEIKFNTNGGYDSGSGSTTLTLINGAVGTQTVTMDFKGMTQYAGSNTAFAATDGNAAGTLKSVSIDSAGVITGTYTNGLNIQRGQIAIAQFNNASGLTKTGNSLYTESNNSGTPNVGTITDLGCTVTPSALEMSNVDMASELTDMIVTQRGYQSNSKIITVSDELLETLINMKR
ncbi:flagellar hook protein FlgE [Anaerovibrio slackiae]|uniref:flagellar hook protein FlgE n=4 Tax=Anaerovibrio TaxID=82373 RepID=UPI00386572AB